MERTLVSSTDVASIGYCPETATLEVEFLKGGIYEYYSVPEQLFFDFLNADSKGRFLNQYIKKGGFSYAKVG